MDNRRTIAPLVTRILTDVAIGLILVAFAAYWWFSPKGFLTTHPRFWLNSVLPIVMVLVGVVAIFVHRRQQTYTGLAILCIAAGGGAACFAGSYLFPVSLRWLWAIGLALLAAGGYIASVLFREKRPSAMAWLPCALAAAAIGVFTMVAQIPSSASTAPINEAPPAASAAEKPADNSPIPFGLDRAFFPDQLQIRASHESLRIVYSLPFYFDRISADGFWSIFAPEANHRDDEAVTRPVPPIISRSLSAGVHTIHYADGSTVELPLSAPVSMELTSYVKLEQDTFSHLNIYGEIVVFGHTKPSLTFSPSPQVEIDVLTFDYPIGRAARFAYLDEAGNFHVVEATSGEKGPFHTLAEGKLSRGEPLKITFHDQRKPLAAITLGDWSQQVSTAVSPTAGWGVPVNAIEFRRTDDKPTSPVIISVTLAATSVGRGWDSVGHRAGIYRNRMRVDFLPK